MRNGMATKTKNVYVNVKSKLEVRNQKIAGLKVNEDEEVLKILKREGLFIYKDFLEVADEIGEGQFGSVCKAYLHLPLRTEVAVKTLSSRNDRVDRAEVWSLLKEGFRMKDLDHDNVIKVIGVSVKDNGYPMVIVPLMKHADLQSYVRNENHKLTVCQLLKFGLQVADGMTYLSSNQVIHRDLAARNCFLDEFMTVKIGDFGLARSLHKYASNYYISQTSKPLPLRWMAIESLDFNKYSVHSDVWSFGVLLWELLTRGETPYSSMDLWNGALLRFLRKGNRLKRPEYCPTAVYSIMLDCWRECPKTRPTFNFLHRYIQVIVQTE